MKFGVCYHATKIIWDELQTAKFNAGQTKRKRVALIHFRMHRFCSVVDAIEAGFTEGTNQIVIRQIRVKYET